MRNLIETDEYATDVRIKSESSLKALTKGPCSTSDNENSKKESNKLLAASWIICTDAWRNAVWQQYKPQPQIHHFVDDAQHRGWCTRGYKTSTSLHDWNGCCFPSASRHVQRAQKLAHSLLGTRLRSAAYWRIRALCEWWPISNHLRKSLGLSFWNSACSAGPWTQSKAWWKSRKMI